MRIQVLFWTTMAMAVLTACQKDSLLNMSGPEEVEAQEVSEAPAETAEPVELALNASVEVEADMEAAETRSTLTQSSGNFLNNKEVGVFIFENSTLTTGKTKYNDGKCISTKANGSGALAFQSPATVYYWPSSGYGLKLYGWYPQAAVPFNTANTATTTTFTVQDDQSTAANYEASDLMFGINENATRTNPLVTSHNASIPFTHKLTRIQVVLTNGSGLTDADLGSSEIYIGDATAGYLKGTVTLTNLLTGAYTVSNTPMTKVLKLCSSYDATNDNNAFAVIPPQNLTDIYLYVKLPAAKGSGVLKVKMGKDLSSGTGKAYKFTVTVSLTQLTLTSSITNWGTGADYTGLDARFP